MFTDIDYTYEILQKDIKELKARYPFIEVGNIGKSLLGRNIYYLRLGRGPVEVFYNGSHHGIEWITTPLLMKFIERFSDAYSKGASIRNYKINDVWDSSSIYIVPMVNPDGVNIAIEGPKHDNPYYYELLKWNNTGQPFSQVWKANARGVDLNRNYPAEWEKAKTQEAELGILGPGPLRYGGLYPLSEPETLAMVNFTRQHNFKLVIAYHSQGKEIYWLYKGIVPPRAREIARKFGKISGYKDTNTPYESAYAGYKDWFIEEYLRPGFTMEVGIGKSPLPLTQFNSIYKNNEEVMLIAPIV